VIRVCENRWSPYGVKDNYLPARDPHHDFQEFIAGVDDDIYTNEGKCMNGYDDNVKFDLIFWAFLMKTISFKSQVSRAVLQSCKRVFLKEEYDLKFGRRKKRCRKLEKKSKLNQKRS
jgi:hypothetical protein